MVIAWRAESYGRVCLNNYKWVPLPLPWAVAHYSFCLTISPKCCHNCSVFGISQKIHLPVGFCTAELYNQLRTVIQTHIMDAKCSVCVMFSDLHHWTNVDEFWCWDTLDYGPVATMLLITLRDEIGNNIFRENR